MVEVFCSFYPYLSTFGGENSYANTYSMFLEPLSIILFSSRVNLLMRFIKLLIHMLHQN